MTTKHMPLEEAGEGMVLAQDLRDAQDQVLLPQGAALTASILQSLRRRGIELVPVACDENAEQAKRDEAAERERKLKRLERLFRKCAEGEDGQTSRMLRQHIAQYLAGGQS